MKIHIDLDTVNQVLGYLGTRPYQEVYQLIHAIQDAARPKEVPVEDDGQPAAL
jgi:hypothetical protein